MLDHFLGFWKQKYTVILSPFDSWHEAHIREMS